MDIFIINTVNVETYDMNLLKKFQKKEISNEKKMIQHCFSYFMVDKLLKEIYKIHQPDIIFVGNKPVLKNYIKHFSISHTEDLIAIAFSDFNCGIDVEKIKFRNFKQIAQRMGFECKNLEEFYECWTKYEAEYKLAEPSVNAKTYKFEGYTMTAVSTNIDEQFVIQNLNF